MKNIIKHFGAGMLAVIVVALLFYIIFRGIRDNNGNVGILNMVGAEADTADIDYLSYQDFDGYQTEAAKTEPEIYYSFPVVTAGSSVKLSDYITAVNYAGSLLTVHITEIIAPDGTIVTADMSGNTNITLAQVGKYQISVYVVDDGNRKTSGTIQLLVNRG